MVGVEAMLYFLKKGWTVFVGKFMRVVSVPNGSGVGLYGKVV